MAVRHLNYCTHCGMPLLATPPAARLGARPDSTHFCRICGHPIQAARQARDLRAVPPLSIHLAERPGIVRWATAAAIDAVLAAVTALLVAATTAQIIVMVTAGGTHLGRGGEIGGISWAAGAVALVAYQPFFWIRHRASPGRNLLGLEPAPRAR